MHFEEFTVGDVYRHARGKTVTEMDGVLITNMVMNTAEAHFNADSRKGSAFPHILVFGGVTISMVIGLATQDTAEHALAELGLDKIRLRAPVTHGTTLYAYTQVLAKHDAARSDAGVVTFKHWGVNQDDVVVFEGERTVLVQRAGAVR
jgi:itaconyl-CoA hydratase